MPHATAARFCTPVSWDEADTPAELREALTLLGEDFPVVEGGDGLRLCFKVDPLVSGYCAWRRPKEVEIVYGSHGMALRAVGSVMAGLLEKNPALIESNPFRTFGIMLDCSRNGVMTVDRFTSWLRRLALLGYNMAMLYTEDTYELDNEPFFGCLRGAYTEAELRTIDDRAHALGIEMIPCLQTLGHLEQILKWPAYGAIKDTGSVLMVGDERTYALIGKILDRWSSVFRGRRVHLGMDETHDLGRGRYLDRHGYRPGFGLFNEHLARVQALCETRGLRPMIWSDMYFRLGSASGDYYDTAAHVPAEVVEKIPKGTDLVYWDYYHEQEAFYLEWIRRHRAMGKEPLMASGVWTWGRFWQDQLFTEKKGGPCLRACQKAEVQEFFVTLWGDDGAYCDFESAWSGLIYLAELAFADRAIQPVAAARLRALTGQDYDLTVKVGASLSSGCHGCSPPSLLWDDPLLLIHARQVRANDPQALTQISQTYTRLAAELAGQETDGPGGLAHAALLARVLAQRADFAERLLMAYGSGQRAELVQLAGLIPALQADLQALSESFRRMWLAAFKPFGLEAIQIRMAGVVARYGELAVRLAEYQTGRIAEIAELAAGPVFPVGAGQPWGYRQIATSSSIL